MGCGMVRIGVRCPYHIDHIMMSSLHLNCPTLSLHRLGFNCPTLSLHRLGFQKLFSLSLRRYFSSEGLPVSDGEQSPMGDGDQNQNEGEDAGGLKVGDAGWKLRASGVRAGQGVMRLGSGRASTALARARARGARATLVDLASRLEMGAVGGGGVGLRVAASIAASRAEADMRAMRREAVAQARRRRLGKRQRMGAEAVDDGGAEGDDCAAAGGTDDSDPTKRGSLKLQELLKSADLVSLIAEGGNRGGGGAGRRSIGQKDAVSADLGGNRKRINPYSGVTGVTGFQGGRSGVRWDEWGRQRTPGGSLKGSGRGGHGRAGGRGVRGSGKVRRDVHEWSESSAWRRHGLLRAPGPLPPLPKAVVKGERNKPNNMVSPDGWPNGSFCHPMSLPSVMALKFLFNRSVSMHSGPRSRFQPPSLRHLISLSRCGVGKVWGTRTFLLFELQFST